MCVCVVVGLGVEGPDGAESRKCDVALSDAEEGRPYGDNGALIYGPYHLERCGGSHQRQY